MLALIQLIKFLNKEQVADLKLYFDLAHDDFMSGDSTAETEIDNLPDFLFNHMGIEFDMREREKLSLMNILINGNYKSAFNIALGA